MAAGDHAHAGGDAVGREHTQLDRAIGEQHAIAGFYVPGEFRVAGGGALAVASHGLHRDDEFGAGLELTAARPEFSQANFRTLQIQQNGGKCAGFPGQRADGFDARPVLLARAVGGVQAEYVHAGGEQLREQRVAGWPECGHDLCVSSHADLF